MSSGRSQWQVAALATGAVIVAAAWGVLFVLQPEAGDAQSSSQPGFAAEPPPEPASLAPARDVLANGRPVTISVLGDSTGNASTEWVGEWAQRLGSDHAVSMHLLNPSNMLWSAITSDYGDGPEVTIWNAGVPGADAEYLASRLGKLQPERPDLVLYSLGHNNNADNIAGQMDDLTAAVREKWGDVAQVAILQNPSTGDEGLDQEATIPALRDWALFGRVPFVDVHAAFVRRPLGPLLLDDELHPNAAGSQLWADVVARALG